MRAETILAKHDERYMPREVVDALKKQGRWQEGERQAMIVEIGHFALILALALALVQAIVAARAAPGAAIARLMGVGLERGARRSSRCIALSFAALAWAHLTSDFSVLNVAENSHSADAGDLQVLRRLGEPRRLDAAVGSDSGDLRRAGGGVRPRPAADACAPTRSPCRA